MALPKYDELYVPFLTVIKDGQVHVSKVVASDVAALLHLSAEELAEQLPSQRQTVFLNRLNWAKTYLKKSRFGGFSQPWKLCHYTGREKAD